jgi:hypothetical protein
MDDFLELGGGVAPMPGILEGRDLRGTVIVGSSGRESALTRLFLSELTFAATGVLNRRL